MSREFVSYLNDGGIVVVTVDRPPVNALNAKLIQEIIDTFEELENNESVAVVILTGAGKAFIAGADIKEVSALDSEEGQKFSALGQGMTNRIDDFCLGTGDDKQD